MANFEEDGSAKKKYKMQLGKMFCLTFTFMALRQMSTAAWDRTALRALLNSTDSFGIFSCSL